MTRNPTLDLVRGLAAFLVAVPHYITLNEPGHALAETIAIAGVEIFFVLSGFVLAPQIVGEVFGGPPRHLGIFLVRRWMRTIPAYLVALSFAALLTGQLFTADWARYALYAQNLIAPWNRVDFYPVAWSLAVEEWFYLLFAPLLFLAGRIAGRTDRRFAAFYAIGFIGVFVIARALASPTDWDSGIRRVTAFRLDSIAWGFLLYLLTERLRASWTTNTPSSSALAMLGLSTIASFAALLAVTWEAMNGQGWARAIFPYTAATLGVSGIWLFAWSAGLVRSPRVARTFILLGSISYSVYLFHLLFAMALKPRLAGWPLSVQLALYCGLLVAFCTLFWFGLERPILAARPDYAGRTRSVASAAPSGIPAPGQARVGPVLAGLLACSVVAAVSYTNDIPLLFYPALFGAAALGLTSLLRSRYCHVASWRILCQSLVVFSVLLPVADLLARSDKGIEARSAVRPAYAFRDAQADPSAFGRWWEAYTDAWFKPGGLTSSIEGPDPAKTLPFLLVPNASGRFFDSTVRINSLGFRNEEFAREKTGQFRIFVLGESPVLGPTLRDGELPFPALLNHLFQYKAACSRPVEVINAGTEAYHAGNSVEKIRRFIAPLSPDLIVSYHGFNGLQSLGLVPVLDRALVEPRLRTRASPLIANAVWRVEKALFDWKHPVPTRLTDEAALASPYAQAYRALIAAARASGAGIVLGTSSLAVDDSSPADVKAFYGSVFKPIDRLVKANAVHNDMLRHIAGEAGVPVLDTTPDIDGKWDDDLFMDLAHFTDRGNRAMAQTVFRALLPLLGPFGVSCTAKP